ncbi:hypothetical protein [Streptomyces sp. PTY087I2]|uniref:hypothetical protein n=1 Tax=Streptomyces sp. PTY087I2 TaxID=1819298 RepID=UPI00159EE0F1|nr:hypothetical protein [Streptomyces sp. PTY087I2]
MAPLQQGGGQRRSHLPQVARIGGLSGLGTANNLRHRLLKQAGVSPSDYRRAFPPA